MKTIFMGTPDFAVPSLDKLVHSRHQVSAVVTIPDKPRGRGRKHLPSPVKKRAMELNLPILQPVRLKDPVFLQAIREIQPDILVVVAFRILPRKLYAIPPYGAVNAHASLLPKFRGAAPIHRAILQGETETGITTFQIEDKVDTGGVLLQKRIPIHPDDTTGSLYDRLKILAAECLLETLDGLESHRLRPIPQDHTHATPAPKIHPEEAVLDFTQPGQVLIRTIRAFAPVPGARFFLKGTLIKIFKARFEPVSDTHPGTLVKISKNTFAIHCGDGLLYPEEIQPEGKRAMNVADFLNGWDITSYRRVDGVD
ncbi:methionyl-tRNA formyltransferase [Fidelibacter multiformis]|jgi:methionyl-tRNA formyltransferase|uniref:methionyl-tRNA formyltransferase n=1 Tax=Fidelibacter multiformis TaxID=3377529 RepID=UPI0037DD07DE